MASKCINVTITANPIPALIPNITLNNIFFTGFTDIPLLEVAKPFLYHIPNITMSIKSAIPVI